MKFRNFFILYIICVIFKYLQEPEPQNMSLKPISFLLIVGLATAELGHKGYSPKHNIKTYGNPFGPVAYNDIGMGGFGAFGSYNGNAYPIYSANGQMYGSGFLNFAGPYKGYGGIGMHGGYPGYGYHNGLGYNNLHNFRGYDMGNFGGINSMSSLGYGAIGFGMGGYGGYGMGGYSGYGMGGYGGYGMGGYSGYGMGGYGGYGMGMGGYSNFGKVFGKNIFGAKYLYLFFSRINLKQNMAVITF